jgi:hypothetical protein
MNRSKMLVSGTAFVIACGLAADATGAQGSGKGKGDTKSAASSGASTTVAASINIQIGSRDRETITKYYTAHPAGLPPGLAKRGGDLPPGLDKQLRRNGSLPPGLQKKLEPFPGALERQVMKLPSGYNWFVLGSHIVVVNKQTNLVGDFALNIVK